MITVTSILICTSCATSTNNDDKSMAVRTSRIYSKLLKSWDFAQKAIVYIDLDRIATIYDVDGSEMILVNHTPKEKRVAMGDPLKVLKAKLDGLKRVSDEEGVEIAKLYYSQLAENPQYCLNSANYNSLSDKGIESGIKVTNILFYNSVKEAPEREIYIKSMAEALDVISKRAVSAEEKYAIAKFLASGNNITNKENCEFLKTIHYIVSKNEIEEVVDAYILFLSVIAMNEVKAASK